MYVKQILVAVFLVGSFGLGGCVSKAEFEAFKTEQKGMHDQIKIDGDSVDLWIAKMDPFLRWVYARSSVLDKSSDPPELPPPPPPDGDWQ